MHEPRRLRFEPLEPREVLSLAPIAVPTGGLTVGTAPVLVPLVNDTTGNVTYTIGTTNSNVAVTQSTTSKILTINVHNFGTMQFLLLDNLAPITIQHITSLVNSGFYNGLTFHRVINDFMIQGGDPHGTDPTNESLSHGSGTTIVNEVNSDTLFTSTGVLAMANAGKDTGDSQFFITSKSTRWLDGDYTIFGKLIAGDSVREAIENVATNSSTNIPSTSVIIDSMTITSDTHDAVLSIKANAGATGSTIVTVTASDGTSQQFTVNINAAPVMSSIADLYATTGAGKTVTLAATDATSDTLTYAPTNASSSNIGLSSDGASMTVTPEGGLTGLQSVEFGVRDDTSTFVKTTVPMFISPAAPLSIAFQPPLGQGTQLTNLNNTAGKLLTFLVTLPATGNGSTVTIYDGTTAIGSASVAAGVTSVTVTTDGVTPLSDGTHTFTAKQSLNYAENTTLIAGRTIAAGTLTSDASASTALAIQDRATLDSTVTLTAADGNVTVRRNGDVVEVVKDSTNTAIFTQLLTETNSVIIKGVANQANNVTIDMASNLALAGGVVVSTVPALSIHGTTGNDVFVLGTTTVTVNGAVAMTTTMDKVTALSLEGGTGDDTYKLPTAVVPVTIVDSAGANSLDFTGATAGITLSLAKNAGESQTIAPWTKTLSINGTIANLTGTSYADTLTGGFAETTIIRGMGGNDILRGGAYDNILLGGAGNNVLRGGRGKNLLIAGEGLTKLIGGHGDSIMVSGTTDYDSNDAALMSILDEGIVPEYHSWVLTDTIGTTPATQLHMGTTVKSHNAANRVYASFGYSWIMLGQRDRFIGRD